MNTMRSLLGTIERALSRPGRNLMMSAVLVLVGLVAIVIGNLRSGSDQLDQAYAEGINTTIAVCTQALVAVFGEPGQGDQQQRGLRVYIQELDGWAGLDELGEPMAGRVVVLVHGLDEPGGIWDQLAPALSSEGHTAVRFDYANDQPIALSAGSFLESLDELRERGVGSIDLVCHSMGGLVVRDAITREGFVDRQIEVERLITIGTPHGGSPWARLRAVAEIREQVQRWLESDDLDPKLLLGFARDGVGEAGTDLLPGSDFLVELDRRAMDPEIEITCIVGRTVGGQTSDMGSMMTTGMLHDLIGPRDAGVIQKELTKLANELGDGVVPMSSAVLDGVSDVVVLEANHRSLVRNIELGEAVRQLSGLPKSDMPPAIEVVLDRLRRQ